MCKTEARKKVVYLFNTDTVKACESTLELVKEHNVTVYYAFSPLYWAVRRHVPDLLLVRIRPQMEANDKELLRLFELLKPLWNTLPFVIWIPDALFEAHKRLCTVLPRGRRVKSDREFGGYLLHCGYIEAKRALPALVAA